jgi:hypothetical protein
MASEAAKREAARGKAMLEEHSRYLEDQYRDWKARRILFPSTLPGDRGAVSPIGGVSPDWEWSGKRKG